MLEHVQGLLQTGSRRRSLYDHAVRIFVSAGGLTILLVLALIFVYLFYIVAPIFTPISIEPERQWAFDSHPGAYFETDENVNMAYQISLNGDINAFALDTPELEIKRIPLFFQKPATAIGHSMGSEKYHVYGFNGGQVGLFRIQFQPRHSSDNLSLLHLNITYPFGQKTIQIAPENTVITQVAFEKNQNNALIAARSASGRVYLHFLNGDMNFLTGDVQWQSSITPDTAMFPNQIDQVLITPNLRYLLLRKSNRLFVFLVEDPQQIELKEVLELSTSSQQDVQSVHFLAGAASLLVVHSHNRVSQWFEVTQEQQRGFKHIRDFKAPVNAIQSLTTELHRKVFYTGSTQGELDIFYATSSNHLLHTSLGTAAIETMAISPRQNALFIQQDGLLKQFKLNNKHPEVSWSSLWHKLWYEEYPEPEFVWQSTSGNDDFEPKFSLVPLAFGTLKAAFYAMLFSVPLAIAGAIYTAYFMTPRLRQVVKPAVEIMEALPTVILGFLAGLWLAPIVEDKLVTILLMIVLLPFATLAMLLFWQRIPQNLRDKIPENSVILILIPSLIFFCAGILSLNTWIETAILGCDTRIFLTQTLGIDYDQRNAFVVGLAMGFAVIPTIFSIAEDALFSVPNHLTQGSLALGATPWQTLWHIVLLTASPGIFSAVMMGLGRAVGETMIVLMATGNTPVMDFSIFQGMRTLSANIAVEMPESEIGSSHYRILFLAALVLFVFTFCFNTCAEYIRQRLREKYSSM